MCYNKANLQEEVLLMQTSQENGNRNVVIAVVIAGIIFLAPLLLYGGLLGLAWLTDLTSSQVASKIIDPKAEAYISQAYPDNDFILEDAYYVFKDNCYRVKVKSRSSQDTCFSLDFDYQSYELVSDGYEISVLSGANTRARVLSDYTFLVDDCFSAVTHSYHVDSDFCVYSENVSTTGYFSPNGLDSKTLIVDKDYDAAELGSAYGYLTLTAVLSKEEVNIHSALDILKEADQLLTERSIGYYLIEITIKDAAYPNTTAEFSLYGVHPEDLRREDALAYLQELWNAQEAHRQEIKENWDN